MPSPRSPKQMPERDTLITRLRMAGISRGCGLRHSDRALLRLRNIHAGRAGFLIGNGPSVRVEDLECLAGQVTFCCNRFHLAYPRMNFRPLYTVSADQTMMDDFGQEMVSQSAGTVFLVSNMRNRISGDFVQLNWRDRSKGPFKFSQNVYHHVWMGGGTLFPAIQLGFHMGIRHFYLYGVDHSFVFQVDRDEEDPFRSARGDANHFIENYRGGKGWSPPQTDHIARSFESCDLFMRCRGGWIKNATRGGKLEVLERIPFDEIALEEPPRSRDSVLLENLDFSEGSDKAPARWKALGAQVRRLDAAHDGGVALEISAPEYPATENAYLHQRIAAPEDAGGGKLRLCLDGRCAEPNMLFAKLDLSVDGERRVITANHPGGGRWEEMALDADLPPGTELGSLHFTSGIRKGARGPAEIANVKVGLRPGRHPAPIGAAGAG